MSRLIRLNEDIHEASDVELENLSSALDAADVSGPGLDCLFLKDDGEGALRSRLLALWRIGHSSRTFAGFQERYGALGVPVVRNSFKKEFVHIAIRSLSLSDCRGFLRLLGTLESRFTGLATAGTRSILGAVFKELSSATDATCVDAEAEVITGSGAVSSAPPLARAQAIDPVQVDIPVPVRNGTEGATVPRVSFAAPTPGALTGTLSVADGMLRADNAAGMLGIAGIRAGTSDPAGVGEGNEDEDPEMDDLRAMTSGRRSTTPLYPPGLSPDEKKGYDSLTMYLPATWQMYVCREGLEFARKVAEYSTEITSKDDLITYYGVFEKETKVTHHFCRIQGLNYDPTEAGVVLPSASLFWPRENRLIPTPFSPSECLTAPQLLLWTRNGAELEGRIDRALLRLNADGSDAAIRGELTALSQHFLFLTDSVHPVFWVRTDTVESMVRRLSALIHIAEEVQRDKRAEAWVSANQFLGARWLTQSGSKTDLHEK